MSQQKYRYGNPTMVPHTAGSNLLAGDVVVVGNDCRIAHSDIANGERGELSAPNGATIYEGLKVTTDVVADGAQLYWDDAADKATVTASTNKKLGIAVAAAGNGATTVMYRHQSV